MTAAPTGSAASGARSVSAAVRPLMAVNCAARMASHAGMMMKETSAAARRPSQADTISGMV